MWELLITYSDINSEDSEYLIWHDAHIRKSEREGWRQVYVSSLPRGISSLPLLLPLICDAKAMWELLITERVVFTINAAAVQTILPDKSNDIRMITEWDIFTTITATTNM